MTLLSCPTCGQCKLTREGEYHRCSYCGALFSESEKADIEQRIDAAISRGLDADLGKLRFRLQEELSAEYPNPDDIVARCDSILDILPEDPVAKTIRAFYRRKSHRSEYHNVLEGLPKLSDYQKKVLYPYAIDLCEHIDSSSVNAFLIAQGDESELERVRLALSEREKEADRFANVPRDVFVCHAHADMAKIQPILDRLEDEEGFTLWYSERNMPKDVENYKRNIENAIEKCAVFLVFASRLSMASPDVQWELDIADKLNKSKRVEYRLEDRNNNIRFRHFFDGIQWVDGAFESNYDLLGERIYSLLKVAAVEAKPAPEPVVEAKQEQPKPEPRPEPKPQQPKSEFKPEPKPQSKSQPQSRPNATPKRQPKPKQDVTLEEFGKRLFLQEKSRSNIEYEIKGKTVEITKCKIFGPEFEIPSHVEGLPVTAISLRGIGGEVNHVLKKLFLPSTITHFADKSDLWTFDLQDIIVDQANPNMCSIDGVIYSKDKKDILLCPRGKSGAFYIPEGVKRITGNSFFSCEKLTEVHIPASVEVIEDYGGAGPFFLANKKHVLYVKGNPSLKPKWCKNWNRTDTGIAKLFSKLKVIIE